MSINDPRLSAFQSNLFPVGLDLGRCVINTDLGVLQAATTATFNAGSIVAQNASGEIVPCVGNTATVPTGVPLGVAKWNKALSYFAAAQDERDKAAEAKQKMTELLLGQTILIRTEKADSFGRFLAEVWLGDLNVNDWLLTQGLARAFKK